MRAKLYRIDGVLWDEDVRPICPKHRLEMDVRASVQTPYINDRLHCEECEEDYIIPRDFDNELMYISRKLKSLEIKDADILNIDGEYVPLSQTKINTKDNKYFVLAKLTETKVGKRIVIYAGEKGKNEKTQIFVEPDISRLSFDQTNDHPSKLFTVVEAEFADGTKQTITKEKKKK